MASAPLERCITTSAGPLNIYLSLLVNGSADQGYTTESLTWLVHTLPCLHVMLTRHLAVRNLVMRENSHACCNIR